MRRADRLFQIVQFLRGRRVTTAKWLSERLQVSERTIYRDMQDLSLSGVPIESEAGVGYVLKKSYDLPPLMFNFDEITALVLGVRMVASQGDKIQMSAESALSKIYSALPKKEKDYVDSVKMFVPNFAWQKQGKLINQINECIQNQQKLLISYQKNPENKEEERTIYTLGLFYWGGKWTMAAWCELRNDFRHFRLDRIITYKILPEKYTLSEHQQLSVFFKQVGADKTS